MEGVVLKASNLTSGEMTQIKEIIFSHLIPNLAEWQMTKIIKILNEIFATSNTIEDQLLDYYHSHQKDLKIRAIMLHQRVRNSLLQSNNFSAASKKQEKVAILKCTFIKIVVAETNHNKERLRNKIIEGIKYNTTPIKSRQVPKAKARSFLVYYFSFKLFKYIVIFRAYSSRDCAYFIYSSS